RELAEHRHLGRTASGTPVYIDERFVAADLRVTLGFIEPHLMLGYPGGPKIQKTAESGDPEKILFPVADLKDPFNFSFSGLKTSVLRHVQKNYPSGKVPEQDMPDLAASFQNAVIKALRRNTERALKKYNVKTISLVGGVAANKPLRNAVLELGQKYNKKVVIPSLEFCGDNGAMIAFRGKTLYESGQKFDLSYPPFPGLPEGHFE
ncbi:MAG: lactate racemase domain-containing protein, partial [Methanococcaceae archaeon]